MLGARHRERRARDHAAMCPPTPMPPAGLCAACDHVRVVKSGRGSVFAMCERGLRKEPGYVKYPPLPVLRCAGFVQRADDPTTTEGR
jgi:hypothetical protein